MGKHLMRVMDTVDVLISFRVKDPITKCWNFTGKKNSKGYGQVQYQRQTYGAHRVIAAICLGLDIKSKLQALHKCDNPSCFNPEHIFVGSAAANTFDMVHKKRHGNTKKTHCKNGHEFTPENTYINEYKGGSRQCKQCTIERTNRYRKGQ